MDVGERCCGGMMRRLEAVATAATPTHSLTRRPNLRVTNEPGSWRHSERDQIRRYNSAT